MNLEVTLMVMGSLVDLLLLWILTSERSREEAYYGRARMPCYAGHGKSRNSEAA